MKLLNQLRDQAVELGEELLPTDAETRPLLGALIKLLEDLGLVLPDAPASTPAPVAASPVPAPVAAPPVEPVPLVEPVVSNPDDLIIALENDNAQLKRELAQARAAASRMASIAAQSPPPIVPPASVSPAPAPDPAPADAGETSTATGPVPGVSPHSGWAVDTSPADVPPSS